NADCLEYFKKIRKAILEMGKLRRKEIENNRDLHNRNQIKKLHDLFINEYIPNLHEILNSYTPPFIVNERPNSIPFPAYRPAPPPTAPEQAQ
ncbi:hypothetical protein, partial [Acetobacter orientalis]|uniref:hypothetical protein n=1 Tax=Acetobacter orientalis TaxID=146474 RepID=UPI0039E7C47B